MCKFHTPMQMVQVFDSKYVGMFFAFREICYFPNCFACIGIIGEFCQNFGNHCTESSLGEQASLKFDLTFGDVLLHKLVQAY